MTRRALDARLEALRALRSTPDHPEAVEQLQKALTDRNNHVVATAAAIAAELRLEPLLPDLLTAFDRFFVDPTRSDPSCLAKTAIAKALRELGHRGADAFVRGLTHVQLEPAWGGRADSATNLRATCALALPDTQLDDLSVLTYLSDALADRDKQVRADSAAAIAALGRSEGALPLRLKLLLGDADADVLGQCFTALLSVAPAGAVAFIARFLESSNEDVQLEAASALAQCRDPEALEVLRAFWQGALLSSPLRRALLMSLGASPQSCAADLLLDVIERDPDELALTAVVALATSRFHAELRQKVSAAVARRQSGRLSAAFEQHFETP